MQTLLFLLFFLVASPLAAQVETADSPSLSAPFWTADTAALAPSSQAGESYEERVRRQLTTLLQQPLFQRTQIGIYIYDLDADSTLFRHGEQQLLRPASTQKVITAITALDRLGADHRFTTSLFLNGVFIDSTATWQGDVIVKGGFDPLFRADDLRSFSEALQQRGIRHIAGNLVFDLSMKDTTRMGWGWCWDDPYRALSPLLFDSRDRFQEKWSEELQRSGISVEGSIVTRTTPKAALLIAQRHHTLRDVLPKMMKESDNLFAESVFYQLAALHQRPFATYQDAAQHVYTLLRQVGLNPKHYQVADGSGLSLYNYTTAEALTTLLRYAHTQAAIQPALFSSLPVAGRDGTLRQRMTTGTARHQVAAKTGTVEGVSSLAGYLTAGNGHRLAFAILHQGLRSTATGRHFQDRVCQLLTAP